MPEPTRPDASPPPAPAEANRKQEAAARDLIAAIEILLGVAERSLRDHTPSGWSVARAALTEAGRLEMGLCAGGPRAKAAIVGGLLDDEDPISDDDRSGRREPPR